MSILMRALFQSKSEIKSCHHEKCQEIHTDEFAKKIPENNAQIRKWSENPLLITAVKAGYEMIALFYIKSILTEFGASTNLEI